MYSNEIFTADKENNAQMMTTLEIAEMMGVSHKSILRKLEGRTEKGKHIDGVIDILGKHQMVLADSSEPQVGLADSNEHQMVLVDSNEPQVGLVAEVKINSGDFFIKSTYVDNKGEVRPCYKCTRKGCELLAHKFQGEKGILFTIRYINRFHDMEQAIKQAQTQQNEQPRLAQSTSNTPIPMASKWRMENSFKIERLMRNMKLDRKGVYHEILVRVGDFRDLEAAKEIYKQERGFEPPYSMSIIEYFTDLQEYADKVIDSLLFMNPDPKPVGWNW